MGLLDGNRGKFIPNCKPQEGSSKDTILMECNPGHLDGESGEFIPESLRPVIIVRNRDKLGVYDDGGANVDTMKRLKSYLEESFG